jgi:hypothetical protein
MSRNHTLFLFFVITALVVAVFDKVGHRVHAAASQTEYVFHH